MNYCFMTHGIALFYGKIDQNDNHSHFALQLTIGIDEPFELESENNKHEVNIYLTRSNEKHKLLGNNTKKLIILAEPNSKYAQCLKDIEFQEYLDSSKLNAIIEKFILAKLEMEILILEIFSLIGLTFTPGKPIDRRVQIVQDIIENTPEKKISISKISSLIELSTGRLQHLFKEEVGIPITQYLLWKRIIDGIKIASKKKDLTTSALEAGFADSAHMSRTFKRMFGLNLSKIFKNSRSVQFFLE